MTYYIFLKSLRSLEEFRKNSHVKIPSKSNSTNFQSLGKFKNLIFNSEILFPCFRPADLAAHSVVGPVGPADPFLSWAKTTLAGPPSPCIGRVFTEVRFPFWFTPSELAASPSSLCQAGPGCQLCPSPPAARARLRHHRFLATPCRPTSDLEMPDEVFTPRLDSPP
jgi:hypothetical protein